MRTCLRHLRRPLNVNACPQWRTIPNSIRFDKLNTTPVVEMSRRHSRSYRTGETEDPSKTKSTKINAEPDASEEPPHQALKSPDQSELTESIVENLHIKQRTKSHGPLPRRERERLMAKETWGPWLLPARPYSVEDSSPADNMSGPQASRTMRRLEFGHMTKMPNTGACRPLLLTFDAYDTLFQPREPIARQYCDVAAAEGLELSMSDVESNFKVAFKELYKTHPNYGKAQGMSYHKWWRILIKRTLEDLIPQSEHGKLRTIANNLLERFSNQEGYQLFPDMQALFALIGTTWNSELWAPRRTMLGVISNSDPRVRQILRSYFVSFHPSLFPPLYATEPGHDVPLFGPATPSFSTLSYNCGYSKPDPMIFDAAVRDAQEALDHLHIANKLTRTATGWLRDVRRDFHHMHVGDDLEKDVIPALKCGWDAVWLDRSADEDISRREIQGHQVTVINNLTALADVVCKERLEHPDGTPTQAPVWIDETREITPLPKSRRRILYRRPIYNRLVRTKPELRWLSHGGRRLFKGHSRGQYDGYRRDWYLRTTFARVFSKEERGEEAARREESGERLPPRDRRNGID